MSWTNYMLYLGSINSEEDEGEVKEKIEVKDSDEIF